MKIKDFDITKNLFKIYKNIEIHLFCRENQILKFNKLFKQNEIKKFWIKGEPKSLNEIKKYVKETEINSYIVPFGLRFPGFVTLLSNQIIDSLKENDYLNKENYKNFVNRDNIRIWLVGGSGAILNSLYKVFPNAEFVVLVVGSTIYSDVFEDDRTTIYEYIFEKNEKYDKEEKDKFRKENKYNFNKIKREIFLEDADDIADMPYFSIKNYDSKIWPTFKKHFDELNILPPSEKKPKIGGKKENFIWNVGCTKTFNDTIKTIKVKSIKTSKTIEENNYLFKISKPLSDVIEICKK